MDFEEISKMNAKITTLRARGLRREAIDLVKTTVSQIADMEDRVPLLLQGLYAAQELNDDTEARQFASDILAIDPDVPNARKILGLN